MLSRIFLAVAGMSANAGLLVLAILAVRLVTRRRMPKWGNCLLWGLVGGHWSRFATFFPTPGRIARY